MFPHSLKLKFEWLDKQKSNPLYWNGIVMGLSLLVLFPLLFLDPRMLQSAPIWIKPIKFSVSIAVYSFTLVWILQFLSLQEKTIQKLSWVLTITTFIEIVCIVLQAGRGISSHFNITTPFNGFIFSLMGTSITVFWVAHLLVTIRILRKTDVNKFIKECLMWGLFIASYGMILGFFMTTPRPEQLEEMKQGILNANGGHTFGAPDGGPGILFFGWSTVAGDMRVPHFFGMHAMQFFSVVAWFLGTLSRKDNNISLDSKIPYLRISGLSIFSIIVIMNVQALSGESIFATSKPYLFGYLAAIFFLVVSIVLMMPNFHRKPIAQGVLS
ncbi:hypothetical protein [Leptospira idonii]|uniref:hypothetical protein n=1 Tax=Leptospira idonii TaxID=1193500 RepID=UPI001AEFCB1E|nr:hypothetical protein [Leptospira idonii]